MVALGGTANQQAAPGQQHPIVEDVATHTSGPSTSHQILLPDNIESGDLIVVITALDGFDAISGPGGWVEAYNNGESGMRIGLYGKIADGTEGGTTVTMTSAESRRFAAQVFRISAWSGDLANIDIEHGSGTLQAETLDTSWGSFAVLWINVIQASMTGTYVSAPAGYSDVLQTLTGNGTSHAQVYSARLLNKASSDSASAWIFDNASGDYSAASIAIKGSVVS